MNSPSSRRSSCTPAASPRGSAGFTLIELLIAVAIIGILASVAIPGYQRYVERSLRADAQAGLHIAAGELERCYTRTYSYGGCSITGSSPDGNYAITYASQNGGQGYLITASTGRRDGCDGDLTLSSDGSRGPDECW
ncbi:type IV pilin protein [uncultured Halomonas sp.]|uniref:type IV pilin protein n=1 Tax=uncultured Halomonas sp. TaxID=173971 RepID=UPI0026310970|nr:type IV pilin protein [uncultured Halomonas sp.]